MSAVADRDAGGATLGQCAAVVELHWHAPGGVTVARVAEVLRVAPGLKATLRVLHVPKCEDAAVAALVGAGVGLGARRGRLGARRGADEGRTKPRRASKEP